MVTLAAGPRRRRRISLCLEVLETRDLLNNGFQVPLNPDVDQFGDQILTVQAYENSDRLAIGIFDTGSAAVTFSAQDQAHFQTFDHGIPIETPGGARVTGVGGLIEGDISKPGSILVDGMHAARIGFDEFGRMTVSADFSGAVKTSGTRALVGNFGGSPQLPTISGAPVLQAGKAAHIDFRGIGFDLDPAFAGLYFSTPDLQFVAAGTRLEASPGSTEPFTVPLGSFGGFTAEGITQAAVPTQSDVLLVAASATAAGRRFLFDTGAQMTLTSTATARALGLDMSSPFTTIGASGVSGQSDMSGFVLDRLSLPSDRGPLSFTQVPVFVSDVYEGIDGILGMNLFNTALDLLVAAGASSFSVTFEEQPETGGPITSEPIITALGGLDIPLVENLDWAALPTFSVPDGEVSGVIFQDLDGDHRPDKNEPGFGDQIVFLDFNKDGKPDKDEPTTLTNPKGEYEFNYIPVGNYVVRVVPDAEVSAMPVAEIPVVVPKEGDPLPPPVEVPVQAATTDEASALVASLYGSILNRLPDPTGTLYWEHLVDNGVTFDTLTRTFWESAEYRAMQIDQYYQQYLGRASDAGGRAFWISAFLRGASEVGVQQGFLTSPEYLATHASDIVYVRGLYEDALNRAPDAGGESYWLTLLQAGVARTQVAKGVLNSTEALLQGVNAFYQQFLDREADEAGRAYWFTVLQQGHMTWSSVALSFLNSEEFLRKQRERVHAL